MNSNNITALFNNYINKFDELNNHDNDERYKWDAVWCVQQNWNIDADNLSEMLKQAFARTDNIIDNRFVHPSTGLIKLAKAEPNTVRELLKDLLQDDHGDIDARQERILHFIDECNALLEKYFPGTWKYTQDMRSVIAYLAMIKPHENYLFKSSSSHFFAKYIEFGNVIGKGQFFKLRNYYNMCDRLIEEIKSNPSLLEKDLQRKTRWTKTDKQGPLKDANLHILAYDLIYCLYEYGLTEGMQLKPDVKKTKNNVTHNSYIDQISEIQEAIDNIQNQIDALQQEINTLPEHNFTGETCKTRAFGTVSIEEQEGEYLYFSFNSSRKVFVLPRCIADGFLIPNDELLIQRYKLEHSLRKSIKDLEEKQRFKVIELRKYHG